MTTNPNSTSHSPAPRWRPTRRDLLRTTGSSAAAIALAQVATAQAGEAAHKPLAGPLRIGLIGCGGRGGGAAVNALRADPDVQLVALGDAFADRVQGKLVELLAEEDIASRVNVPEEHCFAGFDAYKRVIELVDVVLLATPPHFRPEHIRAAVEANKHLFVEKPVAVDAPGVRSVLESVRMADERGLNVVSGLCYRYQHAKRETVQRIHDGAVGRIVTLQTSYNTNGLWHLGRKPEWTDMEWQVRNWLYFTWLSGDHITEQHIHSLDKLAWVMGDEYPVKATASGGRIVRVDPMYGNVFDHFNTTFEWASGAKGFSSCRQWNGAASDVSDHVYGTRGVASLQRHKIEAGPWTWRWRRDEDGPEDDMYQNEHDEFFAAIRSGERINDGDYMCKSTLMAIMARMSAYTGQTVSWEQALSSELDLTPPAYEWGPLAVAEVAQPGVTKFS